jgi:hypothetical protein
MKKSAGERRDLDVELKSLSPHNFYPEKDLNNEKLFNYIKG